MMKFLIVCGGSAGHINPGIAIAEQLKIKIPESEILFIGADKTLEKKLIPDAGFDLINIKMSGLRRGFSPADMIHNIKTVLNLFNAGIKSGKLLKKIKPDAVIGTGGYICYPVLKKASNLKIPVFLLEPNALPGLTTRMLNAKADKIFVTYPRMEDEYKYPERVIYTGTPLRAAFYDSNDFESNSDNKDRSLVISYWGSVGAVKMNDIITEFIILNIREGKFNHIHACGINSKINEITEKSGLKKPNESGVPKIEIKEYIDNMSELMKKSDVAITRAGASTIAELAMSGVPAILIPSPNVTENHQEENAKQAERAGGVIMIRENECTGEKLFNTVVSILDDNEKMKQMKKAQRKLAIPDASEKIVEIILDHCKYRNSGGDNQNGAEHKETL